MPRVFGSFAVIAAQAPGEVARALARAEAARAKGFDLIARVRDRLVGLVGGLVFVDECSAHVGPPCA